MFTYNLQTGQIRGAMAGHCLTAVALKPGASVAMYGCDAGPAGGTVAWDVVDAAPRFRLRSDHSLCLAAAPAPGPGPVPPPGSGVRFACRGNYSGLPFCDHTKATADRVALLLGMLPLEDKMAQLDTVQQEVPALGVPANSFHSEGLHGLRSTCTTSHLHATTFPQVTGMAAAGNSSLVWMMADVMSTEARASANFVNGTVFAKGSGLTYWGPTMNIGRDVRWGRFQESISEDPFLNALYAVAFVRGMQGDHPTYLKVAACCKHLFGYSLEDSDGVSRHNFDAVISSRDLTETYLPAFKACAATEVAQIMCSYNAVNGVPTCAAGSIQNELLRKRWGWGGMIVSDCDAIADMTRSHNYTKTNEAGTAAGITNGCDLDCGGAYGKGIAGALNQTLLTEAQLDVALARTFTTRMRLGMFDPPKLVPYTAIGPDAVESPRAQQLAVEAAEQAVVLLKNAVGLGGRPPVLPVPPRTTLALIGELANDTAVLTGGKDDYCPSFWVTYWQGLHAAGMAAGVDITYTDGSSVPEALRLAEAADAALVFDGGVLGHEGSDRTNVSLDVSLATAVLRVQSRTALVIVTGEPVALDPAAVDALPAAVFAFEGGQSAGTGFASVVLGDVSPSGMLPFSVYTPGIEARLEMTDMSMRPSVATGSVGRTYRFSEYPVVFPFGHGLSYTEFELSWASAVPSTLTTAAARASNLTLEVTVRNVGAVRASKVVQAYISKSRADDPAAPIASLFALAKVDVPPHGTATATLAASSVPGLCGPFCTVDAAGGTAVLAGGYTIFLQPDRQLTAAVRLTGPPVQVDPPLP